MGGIVGTTDDEINEVLIDEDIAVFDLKETVDIDGRPVVIAKGVVTTK